MCNNRFREELLVNNNEQKRLEELMEKYENDEITEKQISKEDKKALTYLYTQETDEINMEIKKRKRHIEEMMRVFLKK